MAKKTTPSKTKEPVKLRFKKLANGNTSIYLDVYREGKRHYEFLQIYLIPERTRTDKIQNENALQAANAIKAQMVIDIMNGKAGIHAPAKDKKLLLTDWLETYRLRHEEKGEYTKHINQLKTAVIQYKGEKVTMQHVDKKYCMGFIDFMRNTYRTATGKPVAQVTARNYCQTLANALKAAEREGIIQKSPLSQIDPKEKIKVPESTREYLTIDEVKALIATPCKQDRVKRAFLFSVFCGLRISDIEALTWGQVITDRGQTRLNVVMKKTKEPLYLPLSKEALRWMPERDGKRDDEAVFDIPRDDRCNILLRPWVKAAGITKRVTFHVARHTFATMELTLGADLYTTSKLLGHKDVTTTQIYAKIIDKKKDEAVNLTDGIF